MQTCGSPQRAKTSTVMPVRWNQSYSNRVVGDIQFNANHKCRCIP